MSSGKKIHRHNCTAAEKISCRFLRATGQTAQKRMQLRETWTKQRYGKRRVFKRGLSILKLRIDKVRWAWLLVYLDLVIVLNFLVDFLLLVGVNRLTGYPVAARRACLAATMGGIYAGVCMLPGCAFLGNLIWRSASLVLISAVAFGWNGSAIRRGALFVLLSMALGGMAVGMSQTTFLHWRSV